ETPKTNPIRAPNQDTSDPALQEAPHRLLPPFGPVPTSFPFLRGDFSSARTILPGRALPDPCLPYPTEQRFSARRNPYPSFANSSIPPAEAPRRRAGLP